MNVSPPHISASYEALAKAEQHLGIGKDWRAGRNEREVQIIEEDLDKLARAIESNPLITFVPFPKQASFLAARERTKSLIGGNRAGKTEIGVVDDLLQLLGREFIPAHLQRFKRWEPPFYLRVVVPTFGPVLEGGVLQKFRELCPPAAYHGGSFGDAHDKVGRKLRFANGSWVLFGSGEQEPSAHASIKLHRCHFDEEPKGYNGYEVFLENRKRVQDYAPDSQIMLTMTAENGLSWTFDEIFAKRHEPDVFCIRVSRRDNPHMDQVEVEKDAASMGKERAAVSIDGHYMHLAGKVLNVTDDHIIDPLTVEQVKEFDEIVIGFDPALGRAGLVWIGFKRLDYKRMTAVVFDEMVPKNMGVSDIVAQARLKNAKWGIGNVVPTRDEPKWIIDPAYGGRGADAKFSVKDLLMQEEIFPTNGDNRREEGILEMRQRLSDGALVVTRNCQNWLHEADRYLVADSDDERDNARKGAKGTTFRTVGKDDLMDPTRYVLMKYLWHRGPIQKHADLKDDDMSKSPPIPRDGGVNFDDLWLAA